MEPAPTAPVRDNTSAYSNGAPATALRFKECGLRMENCIRAAEIQRFHLDTHPKLWQKQTKSCPVGRPARRHSSCWAAPSLWCCCWWCYRTSIRRILRSIARQLPLYSTLKLTQLL